LVEITRGRVVESGHRGAAAVVAPDGRVVMAWGDIDRPIYPRSAVKPIQALPLVQTGAARALGIKRIELALACASHSGEPGHTDAVRGWLERLGYGPADLECGAHAPTDRRTRNELIRRGEAPSALHNNCSGKHAGFLAVCRHMGFPSRGYIEPAHPVQRLVREALAAATGADLERVSPGVDGCGIPAFAIPLRALAHAMTVYADRPPHAGRAPGAAQIRDAVTGEPWYTAGRDRFATRVMEAAAGNVLVKTGAEGTCCAAIVDRGLGIAVKIDDGAQRAVEVAAGAVLRRLGGIDDDTAETLRDKLEPDIMSVAGGTAGAARPSPQLRRAR